MVFRYKISIIPILWNALRSIKHVLLRPWLLWVHKTHLAWPECPILVIRSNAPYWWPECHILVTYSILVTRIPHTDLQIPPQMILTPCIQIVHFLQFVWVLHQNGTPRFWHHSKHPLWSNVMSPTVYISYHCWCHPCYLSLPMSVM
jgi:hypothetical protein